MREEDEDIVEALRKKFGTFTCADCKQERICFMWNRNKEGQMVCAGCSEDQIREALASFSTKRVDSVK